MNAVERLGADLFAEHGTKEAVAFALGYFPASLAANLYDTYGLHPADMLPAIKREGLAMDWGGFEYEMAKRGADVRSLIQEFKERL